MQKQKFYQFFYTHIKGIEDHIKTKLTTRGNKEKPSIKNKEKPEENKKKTKIKYSCAHNRIIKLTAINDSFIAYIRLQKNISILT